ncbi:tyrosine-type recombinase/integrase [Nocardioides sp. 503]|uniref:tyrosine-type recombinase/integrase n=1 Tax=Nocardioides sp. 503 TaxID=2508326 RepID=UPI00106F7871|nr:tyrosine-type recombinase/integrase [Nocardioides sp. 503]
MAKRREYGEGSVYQRQSDRRWIATIEVGETAAGTRRRITVSVKSTGKPKVDRAAVVKKLRDKRLAIEASGTPTQSARTTVKQWALAWLDIKKRTLAPRGYNAAASPVRRWIIPTIGHKRLETLTPADLRAVADAQRQAGRKEATAAATHRTLLNLLRAAIVEGHQVPQRVLLVPAPKTAQSDRMDLTLPESVACLRVAADLPHGVRWAMALLYGPRQGEVLGLTEDYVDFDAHEIRLEWQLDNLPYNVARDRTSGFRVPDGYDARQLVDSWHLVRPKSKAGVRVLPMTPAFETAMRAWLEQRPANPWGLVFPAASGRPANDKSDLAEWYAIQGAAALATYDDRTELGPVPVGHPAGRYFKIHECRNVTATQLGEAGVDPEVIKSLLGHSTAAQSGEYRRIHRAPKLEAVELVASALQYGQPA